MHHDQLIVKIIRVLEMDAIDGKKITICNHKTLALEQGIESSTHGNCKQVCVQQSFVGKNIISHVVHEILAALGENQIVIECENGETGQTQKLRGFDLQGQGQDVVAPIPQSNGRIPQYQQHNWPIGKYWPRMWTSY
jgi:hypothetical protein